LYPETKRFWYRKEKTYGVSNVFMSAGPFKGTSFFMPKTVCSLRKTGRSPKEFKTFYFGPLFAKVESNNLNLKRRTS